LIWIKAVSIEDGNYEANTHPLAQASMKLSEAMYGPAQAGFRNDVFCYS
jgi:hypothetical protein